MNKREKFIESIPFALLGLVQIYSLTQIVVFQSFFDWRNVLGLGFFAVCIFLFFISKNVYRFALLITLLFGCLSAINLTIDKLSIGLSLGVFNMFGIDSVFKIELIPCILLILFIILNRKHLKQSV